MNSSLKIKLPDRLLENYALAGSLILHAGFIGLFSAWQWDWTAPEKTPPKIINVKFIPAPPSSRPSEHPATPRSVSGSPAQPRGVHPSAITPLKARTPSARIPVPHPFKKIHRMASPHTIIHPSPLNKRASLLHETTQPRPAHPYMITPASHGSAEKVEVRPAPAFTGPPASPIRAVAVASLLTNSRQKFIPKMSPTAKVRFYNVKDGTTPTALAAEPATAKFIHLKPRPGPATHKSPTFSTAGFVPEAAVKRSSFQKAESPLQASLSGDGVNNDPAVDDPAGEAVDALRGLFTSQVRQRIAAAQYYPRLARQRGMEGRTVISFILDQRGRLTKVDLAQTSGYPLLDRAALEAVHNGAPYPEIPAPLKTDSFQFKLPISFVLK